MKARMKNNLVARYKELDEVDEPEKYIVDFLLSIEGKEVDLVFICQDAFEKNDGNIWLPDSLWDEILVMPCFKCSKNVETERSNNEEQKEEHEASSRIAGYIALIAKQQEYINILLRECHYQMGQSLPGTTWEYQEEAMTIKKEMDELKNEFKAKLKDSVEQ